MAEQPVDEKAPPVLTDARHVVGKGGAEVAAHLDDLGLAEGRMDRVGGADEIEQGAGADPAALLVLDHGRADHEAPVAARHDVDGIARMEQLHRPRERHVAREQDKHLALDAAQIGQAVAGGEAAAIDDPVGLGIVGLGAAETPGDALALAQAPREFRRRPRGDRDAPRP